MTTPAQITAAPRIKKRGHRLENPPDCSAGRRCSVKQLQDAFDYRYMVINFDKSADNIRGRLIRCHVPYMI